MELFNGTQGNETDMVGLNSHNVPCISWEVVEITKFLMKLCNFEMRCTGLAITP